MQKKPNDLLRVSIARIVSTDQSVTIVLSARGEERAMPVDYYEATPLSFHVSGLSKSSYIKTIHETMFDFIVSSGYKFVDCIIDDYSDGLGYCRIRISKNNTIISFKTSIVNGFIFSQLGNINIFCFPDVWEQISILDDDISTLQQEY